MLKLKEEYILAEEKHEEEKLISSKEGRSKGADIQLEMENTICKLEKEVDNLKENAEKLNVFK